MGSVWHRLQRWTVLAHLYLGIGFALLFVMWFATGIVLMYAPFPGFGVERDHARMPALHCDACTIPLATMLSAIGPRDTLTPVRVGMLGDRPVLRALGMDRRWATWYADDLRPVAPIDGPAAAEIAARAVGIPATVAHAVQRIDEPDQWTMEGIIRRQLPMWRVDFTDAAGTRVYVSVHGAESVVGSTRRERTLAWIGAIPHWLYPRVLRARVGVWIWTIIVLGALGTVMSVAGVAVGVWQTRWRRRRRDGRPADISPYRPAWMRWHHLTGLVVGLVTCTWIFSGMMSVTPFDWSPGDHPDSAMRRAFAGGEPTSLGFALTPAEVVRGLPAGSDVRELEPRLVAGEPRWVAFDGRGGVMPLRPGGAPGTLPALDLETITRGARLAGRAARITAVTELRTHDSYYYNSVERTRPLPVVRIDLADDAATALYVDPARAELVMRQERRSRWERWLYHGLHDLDFPALRTRRPLWDIVVILLSLGGLVLSWSGVVVGWRWLAHRSGVPAGPRR